MFLLLVLVVVVVGGLYINSERRLAEHNKSLGGVGGGTVEPQTPEKTDTVSIDKNPKASIIREDRNRPQEL